MSVAGTREMALYGRNRGRLHLQCLAFPRLWLCLHTVAEPYGTELLRLDERGAALHDGDKIRNDRAKLCRPVQELGALLLQLRRRLGLPRRKEMQPVAVGVDSLLRESRCRRAHIRAGPRWL